MKYLHVTPPWYVFHDNLRQPNVPLGAAYLARWAQKAGWEPYIWNGDLLPAGAENDFSKEMKSYAHYLRSDLNNPVWDELRWALKEVQPDVVGITVLTPSYPSALMVADIVREETNAKIVVGGPHISAGERFALDIDNKILGEGEIELYQYLKSLMSAYVFFDTKPNSLDYLGYPLRRCLDRYGILKPDNYGLVMFSRGCPFKCGFCASSNVWGRTVRYRSAKDMAAEMIDVHESYDTRYFSFQDDTFTVSRKRILELMREIMSTGLMSVPGFRWTCNTRPELLDAELIAAMKGAGCAAIAIGIEFGSRRMLEKVNKGFTVQQVRDAARMIKEADVMLSGQFMFGYPTETEDEMWQTVALADELECDSVMVSVATPLPDTPLYYEAKELGLIGDIDWGTVTTKNDGMLMTIDEPQRVVREVKEAFDKIQSKTLDRKNRSRLYYESQYMNDASPRYGID